MILNKEFSEIIAQAAQEISKYNDLIEIEQIKSRFLGKNSTLTASYQQMKSLEGEEKKNLGQQLNELKNQLAMIFSEKIADIQQKSLENELMTEKIDITLPAIEQKSGTIHPVSYVMAEVINIWKHLGFNMMDGPEIENEDNNFTLLNIPTHHPARQSHDTFYTDNGFLLRTHTSNIQVRAMKDNEPPFKFIAPGRVYRADSDATHTPMFHQLEGVYIDKNISVADLKSYITKFLQIFFENDKLKIRMRPSYFPFTEPSMEIDIGYSIYDGQLKLGGDEKWLEILGCGMVYKNVLENLNIDPNIWQGFAFGCGIERLTMLKYGVDDLRKFFENDLRFHEIYGFKNSDDLYKAGV